MSDSLSISLVIYHPDETLLSETLRTLFLAADKANAQGLIDAFFLTIVDNSNVLKSAQDFKQTRGKGLISPVWDNRSALLLSPNNVGYGAGHNLAIQKRCDSFHLVINPDVLVHEDALIECIHYLQQNLQVGMVTPLCFRPDGRQEYLCKAYPSLWILLLRGFAPNFIKHGFRKQIAAYELSNQANVNRNDVLIASGCFMFFRKQALLTVEGFCEQFFLYFEDFDLSLRLISHWQIAFVPTVKIIHHGGHSAKKGLRHIILFIRSAGLFFSRHGWRFW